MAKDDPASRSSDEDLRDLAAPSMGAMVIRTWHEPDQMPGFRARLTYSETPNDEPGIVLTADPDEVLRVVRQWLSARSGPSRES